MKALVVTYQFPPTGGAGVQRALKLVKYLPDFGVTPAVMTPANPSVPLTDESMLAEVDPAIEIVRPRTFEPGYGVKRAVWQQDADSDPPLTTRLRRAATSAAKSLLVPDVQVLWQPAAQVALAGRLARRADDAVWITAPPFSQFLLAPSARASRGVGVVLDYRDEWTTIRSAYEMMSGRAAARAGELLESSILRSAHAVTTATPAFRDALLEHHPFLDPGRVHAISNGYDPDDYPAELPNPPTDRFVVTYAGTIFSLTSPRGLLEAIDRLEREQPELAALLEVRFIGRVVETELERFDSMKSGVVTRLGYVPKGEVIRELAASHLTLCLLDDLEVCRRIYPAKIFELMYLGRPTLTLAPAGELARLVDDHQLGACLAPRDSAAIASYLADAVRAFRAGTWKLSSASRDIERFHRRALAAEMADVLRDAVAMARGGEKR